MNVLLVEDNPGDVRLIERTFAERALPGEVHAVKTGDDALDFLHRHEGFADAPRPDLVLLDLNLPATDGRTVLGEIKSDPRLKRTPVVVLTGSGSDDDLVDAYERSANAYLIKPVDPAEFADVIESVVEFWADAATLPPASADG